MTGRRAAAFAALLLLAAPLVRAQDGSPSLDVPFVTTPDNVTLAMLEAARVGPADLVIDLGSGDGRIPILAARRFGARGFGVEIDPALVHKSVSNARRAGVDDRVQFRVQDLFLTDLSPATVVTMYLLPQVNLQLRPTLLALKPGTRIVSHDYDLGDWQPDRTVVVPAPDKPVGLDKTSRVHAWTVPARVDGLWCADGTALRIAQTHQRFAATVQAAGADTLRFDGRVEDGTVLRGTPAALGELQLRDGRLHAAATGRAFTRAAGDRC